MSNFFDRCGMTVAGLCGVHCVALVALSLAQPLLVWSAASISWLRPVEILFAVAAGFFAGVALLSGYRHHGHIRPVLLGGLALGLLWIAVFSGVHEQPWTPGLTVLAGAFLIVAHRWNIQCRCAHSPRARRAPGGALENQVSEP